MLCKFIKIIRNFFKTLSFKETLEITIPSLVVGIVFFFSKNSISQDNISDFISEINDSTLTVMSLLVAFGLGVVTLIYSSSSKSIENAKKLYIDGKTNINNIPINYYQLLLIRIYYSLLLQIIMVLLSLLIKIFFYSTTSLWLVWFEIIILIHAILVEIKVIISMYHLMWKD